MVEQWARLISEGLWKALTDTGVERTWPTCLLLKMRHAKQPLQQCSEASDSFVVAWGIVRRFGGCSQA